MKSKISVLLTVAIFSCAFAFGQDKNCIGKWKLFPQPQDGMISYLTIKEESNEYVLVRTKDPKQTWKMTWNKKANAFDVDLDGKQGTINIDNKTKHLIFKAIGGGKFEMVADK
jgi:hypothetical protein